MSNYINYTTAMFDCVSAYNRDRGTIPQRVYISDPRHQNGTCCGLIAGDPYNPCNKPAKNSYTVEVKSVKNQKVATFTTEVDFCKTHDPVLKAERKASRIAKETAAHRKERSARECVMNTHQRQVAQINELAGRNIVTLGYDHNSRMTSVVLLSNGVEALISHLNV